MRRNIHLKLVLILVLLIVSLMVVVGAFLMNSVTGYYINEFYSQIAAAFGQDNADFVRDLQNTSEDETDGAAMIEAVLSAYEGVLGVDRRTRNFYVLDGSTGRCLAGSAPEPEGGLAVTPNLSKALRGKPGFESSVTADYMDAAIPITRGGQSYIVYILDNRQTAQALNSEMFSLIIEAMVLGLIISILLSFLLSSLPPGGISPTSWRSPAAMRSASLPRASTPWPSSSSPPSPLWRTNATSWIPCSSIWRTGWWPSTGRNG